MQFYEMYMDKIHNHEVAGSIPAPATKQKTSYRNVTRFLFSNQYFGDILVPQSQRSLADWSRFVKMRIIEKTDWFLKTSKLLLGSSLHFEM